MHGHIGMALQNAVKSLWTRSTVIVSLDGGHHNLADGRSARHGPDTLAHAILDVLP